MMKLLSHWHELTRVSVSTQRLLLQMASSHSPHGPSKFRLMVICGAVAGNQLVVEMTSKLSAKQYRDCLAYGATHVTVCSCVTKMKTATSARSLNPHFQMHYIFLVGV